MRKKEIVPKFSDDHDENIEMQNNYLLMKIMLESNAEISSSHPQTPEMKNSFLKFVIKNKLHLSFSNKVADLLGNPEFPDEKDLDKEAFKIEYNRLKNLLYSHYMKVKYHNRLSERKKYNFIVKELFEYETDQNPELPMTFYYNFFHRDFESEIREAADFFMADFFENELTAENNFGIEEFQSPKNIKCTQQEFVKKIDAVYPLFSEISDCTYHIEKVNTDTKLVKSNFEGDGFCEGTLSYSIKYPNGDMQNISGNFKIYFSLQYLGFLVSYYEIAGVNLASEAK
ncbi:MAG TPA: hypothetical protein VFT78_12860 [Hanamia sp.]|nr:hypothetical protein [Hanamia sp.]